MIYKRNIIINQRYLFMQTVFFFSCCHFGKSLAHDSYQHIHKYNTIKKSSWNEHNPAASNIRACRKGIIWKLSDSNKVCRNKWIDNRTQPIVRKVIQSNALSINIYNKKESSESNNNNKYHNHKKYYILYSTHNQINILCCARK